MKFLTFLVLLFISSCARGKEVFYTGSTPAGKVVRSFLGVSLSDSIDFIRWRLTLRDTQYTLECHYGIGKPNTDGFVNDNNVNLSGNTQWRGIYCYLQNGNKTLTLVSLNSTLFYLADEQQHLLVGTAGWSYVLNGDTSQASDAVTIVAQQSALIDSMIFQGRTPCWNFAGIHPGENCVKQKWYVVLFSDAKTHKPSTYYVRGTAYGNNSKSRGNWNIITGKGGRIIYQLHPQGQDKTIDLVKLDDNILMFTDNAKLLIGDRNFSFALNRKL